MTNVEALTEIALGFLLPGDEYDRRNRAHAIALHLAKSGCLQVDSLTDEQVESAWFSGSCTVYAESEGDEAGFLEFGDAEVFRSALRRCATGEAEP